MPDDNKALNLSMSDKVHCVKRPISAYEYHLRKWLLYGGMVDLNAPLPNVLDADIIAAYERSAWFKPDVASPHHTCSRCNADTRAGYHLCTPTPISSPEPNPTPVQGIADDDKQ